MTTWSARSCPAASSRRTADFNGQLQQWLQLVNTRAAAGVGLRAERPDHRRPSGDAALPPVAPATGWRISTRLARDHYIRLDTNDYSVHPAVIGRRIEVIADLQRVRVLCDGARR